MVDLLIVSAVWPEPGSSAAGRRMTQLINLFQSRGWGIMFASTAAESEYAVDLSAFDIETVSIKTNSRSFDSFIKELDPKMVMFDRFHVEEQFGWRVAECCPDALRILDTEDLHCLRLARQQAVEQNRTFSKQDLLRTDHAKREIASILRCDLSLIISEFEMRLLQHVFGVDDALLYYLPFLLDSVSEEAVTRSPAFEERNHFMTIGNFRHPPNWDSVQYLKDEIWPRIAGQLPEAEMHIYGAYPSPKVKSLHQPEMRFFIEGRTEGAAAVMRKARICLAPLRFGAGLKGKLVEAMECGTPSVTTSIGAEGIASATEWPGVVVDPPQQIADAAVNLYKNKAGWEKAHRQGFKIINERFAKDKFATAFADRIDELRNHLDQHRLHNFTGAMLMHHRAASTKYMGRWIEVKNRLK